MTPSEPTGEFYHATPLLRVPRILREGLRPNRVPTTGSVSPRPHVYVFDTIESAAWFALVVHWRDDMAILELALPSSWLDGVPAWESPPLTPEPRNQWRVSCPIPVECIMGVSVVKCPRCNRPRGGHDLAWNITDDVPAAVCRGASL